MVPRRTRWLRGDPGDLAAAAGLLRAGGLVAIPTETVYGLAADAADPAAVASIFAAKDRPRFNPLIAHCLDLAAASREGAFTRDALLLAERFWPGPLTVVVPREPAGTVCDLARAGLETVALRLPGHPLARELLAAVGRPVAAPSANRSGHVSPTRADHVVADLDGRIDAVLDGGPSVLGVESTIVACLPGEPVRLLRPGGIPREALESALGRALAGPRDEGAPAAPGMLPSHYAPRATVRMNIGSVGPDEAVLLFGPEVPVRIERARARRNLSPGGDLAEAAASLFTHLRYLDGSGARSIGVVRVPGDGLGEAINDRLARASAPRPVG